MKYSAEKYNILYLDDEQSNLDIFRISFKRKYNIFTAIDHIQAFDILKNNTIHLILTDQQMPVMKGTEFLERTLEDYPDIIRMIITGYADIAAVIDAINKCGIYKYITKPYEREDMAMTLDKAFETLQIKKENKWLIENLEKNLETLESKYFEQFKQAKEYARRLEKKNEEVSAIRKKLEDNIQYASRIQQALLPKPKDILNFFGSFFAINAPLDVVSGDFYWFSQPSPKEAYLAVIDCTGHGVSGAFMSIIAHDLFENAIQQGYKEPKAIFDYVNKEITRVFEGSETNDGMDATLCHLEKLADEQYKVSFVGAKRPVFILQSGFLLEVLGSRKSIGGLQIYETGEYEQHNFHLQKNDQIYMFSDGWTDSANEERKKYGLKRLRELILQTHTINIEEQEITLMQDLVNFKQDTPQRDDILLLSVRL
ncbi:MAG: SpoIIE family protein phosphatase [Thermonemataceae bacterium]|nr:SpoIIE family protein phosphatase [Thermonemataceae bacterium]